MKFRRNTKTYEMFFFSKLKRRMMLIEIALFTVTVANEARLDLALIQPFLLYCAKLVVVMLTSIFKKNFH